MVIHGQAAAGHEETLDLPRNQTAVWDLVDKHPGDELPLTLLWLSAQPISKDYTLWLKLFGANDELLGAVDTYPGFGMFPTSLWPPNRPIADAYRLRISPEAHLPTYAKLVAGFYERDSLLPLAPSSADGARLSRPVVARVKLLPKTPGSTDSARK